MKLLIESLPQKACPLSSKELHQLAVLTIQKSDFPFSRKQLSLSAAYVSPGSIRKLNQKYRHRDQATDILSFGEYADSRKLKKEKKSAIFLGELIICCSVVKKSAKLNEVSFRREFGYIFAHGILHLLGLEHGEKMFAIQDWVTKKLK